MSRKSFLVTTSFLATAFLASAANAQAVAQKLTDGPGATALVGAGLAIGIAAVGGALGQGRAATAALEGIARNPSAADKLFTPMILGLALIESLVIYALVIAFMILGKVG
jgi:F-type H+-transporting ATPase subunit c